MRMMQSRSSFQITYMQRHHKDFYPTRHYLKSLKNTDFEVDI